MSLQELLIGHGIQENDSIKHFRVKYKAVQNN